jgi:hypothetical protein
MKKQNVLFLVHVEEMFRRFFPDEMYALRLMRACQAKKYDRVFLMISCVEDDQPIEELCQVTHEGQHIEWGWGYEPDMFNDEEKEHVISALGHEWTWVPPELREMQDMLKRSNVFVGGGYESECLQDFVDVLDHLEIDHKKVRGYVY